jgi:predicted TIM-barrel fold metal-dependent hydrolase
MTERIIDFHTHAFPDALAHRAMKALMDEAPGIKAYLDGTVASLLRSMDDAGIETSVICCIATKPAQYEPILRWCQDIRSERLIPFPSVHPADPDAIGHIRQIKAEGFLGVKLHPFYQDFFATEDRMRPFYEEVFRQDLLLVMHTGFDIAFPRIRRADPETILKLHNVFPDLRFVATHLGAWQQWDEVPPHLLGRPILMELSLAPDDLSESRLRDLLMEHPADFLLFGTDSPWSDQKGTVSRLKNLGLPRERLTRILYGNAARLLGLEPS